MNNLFRRCCDQQLYFLFYLYPFCEQFLTRAHGLSCFNAVILDQFTSNANPLATLECTQLCFGVCVQLLGNILLRVYYLIKWS